MSFTTVYCQKPHRLSDGEPVGHRCRIIPPEGLAAERAGDVETFLDALERRPFVFSDGIPQEGATNADADPK